MNLVALFLVTTTAYHLPSNLLAKICFVESSHRADLVVQDTNGRKSMGICQIQLRTAKYLGFDGEEEDLLDPATNIKFAGKYLYHQYRRYHSWIKAVKAYNAGFAKTNKPNEYYIKVHSVNIRNQIPRLLVSVK